jgi:hypothetical protein
MYTLKHYDDDDNGITTTTTMHVEKLMFNALEIDVGKISINIIFILRFSCRIKLQ